jgi:hypothetical protein
MGLMGVITALVGSYGLMPYAVSRRTREIGIRMAIGAGAAGHHHARGVYPRPPRLARGPDDCLEERIA